MCLCVLKLKGGSVEKAITRATIGEARGGQSTYISFAFIMLLLLALSLPLVEFTRMMGDQRDVNAAALDLARFVAEDYANHRDTSTQRNFLNHSYPELSTASFTVSYGPQKIMNYQHHLPKKPSDPDGGWNTRPSRTTSQEVKVDITLNRTWITPMKMILSLPLMGNADGYTVEGVGSTDIDQTVSGGW